MIQVVKLKTGQVCLTDCVTLFTRFSPMNLLRNVTQVRAKPEKPFSEEVHAFERQKLLLVSVWCFNIL